MKSLEEYESDVIYEVWRRGGNVDNVDLDRIKECHDEDLESDEAAYIELKIQE